MAMTMVRGLLAVLVGVGAIVGSIALAQTGKPAPGKALEMTAEELAKECAADSAKANKKYAGKMIRVTGIVGQVYDDMLYLPTKVKRDGDTLLVGIRYGEGNKPAVKKGETATFEGKFELVAVLGPLLTGCKLVPAAKK
jgi:tRNA_anti-like